MTTSSSRPAALAPPAAVSRLRVTAVGWVIIASTLVAVGLRLFWLSRPGYLMGITEYDDGTDFGSAIRLVHGVLPYRDFIMVQPPGITILMAPVAFATKSVGAVTGMAAGRVLTALASAAGVPLIGLLTRHRGLIATIIACGVLAVFPDSLGAAKTVLLEPWLVLFCLLGALAVFDGDHLAGRRRLVWGGVAFGFAGAIKVWAVLPVLVILVLAARRPRRAAAFTAGVVAGFAVPVLPFALGALPMFYRSVIVAQLVRSDALRIPEAYRLQQMLGLSHLDQMSLLPLVIISLVVAGAVVAVAVLGSRLEHRLPPALDWFALVTCLLVAISFLAPPDFYYHYPAFLAPFLGLALALPVSRLLTALAASGARPRLATVLRRGAIATAVLTLVVLAALQAGAIRRMSALVSPAEIAAAKQTIPPGSCVLTDQVSYTIAINRFTSSNPACSRMVDGIGSDYALANGRNGLTGAGSVPAVEHMWMSALRAARYVWLTGQASRRIPWTPQLQAYFDAHFVPLTEGPDWLYLRRRS